MKHKARLLLCAHTRCRALASRGQANLCVPWGKETTGRAAYNLHGRGGEGRCAVMRFASVALLALVVPFGVRAAPAPVSPPPGSVVEDAVQLKAKAVAAVGAAEIEGYVPYGWFSAIAYCPPETRTEWQCSKCVGRRRVG